MLNDLTPAVRRIGHKMPRIPLANASPPRFKFDHIKAIGSECDGIDLVAPSIIGDERKERDRAIRLIIGQSSPKPLKPFLLVEMRRRANQLKALKRAHAQPILMNYEAAISRTSTIPSAVAS